MKRPDKATIEKLRKELLSGAIAAMSYTEEEIYATFPPDEAKEFIGQRKRIFSNGYRNAFEEDATQPIAADETASYN